MKFKILSISLGIAFEAFMALVFFVLIPDSVLESNIRALDFIVTTVVVGLWWYNMLTPAVNLDDPSHKEVGSIGIKWTAVAWYDTLALLTVFANLYQAWTGGLQMSFTLQVFIQIALVLLLAGSLLVAEATKKKTAQIYRKEQQLKSGKVNLQSSLTQLLYEAEDIPRVPEEVKARIRRISESARYITPSGTPEALAADVNSEKDCLSLRASLFSYEMNKELVEQKIDRLERDMQRRRQSL